MLQHGLQHDDRRGILIHMRDMNGNIIDPLDIIIRDQVATWDGKLMRGEITDAEHTAQLRMIVEAVS